MGWEQRDGRSYYYRKRRVGRRVVSEYVGSEVASLIAASDAQERAERTEARRAWAARLAVLQAEEAELEQGDELVAALTQATLLLSGYRRRRGQWRRRRPRDG